MLGFRWHRMVNNEETVLAFAVLFNCSGNKELKQKMIKSPVKAENIYNDATDKTKIPINYL